MHRAGLLFVLAGLLGAAACGSGQTNAIVPSQSTTKTAPPRPPLEGTTWELTAAALDLPGLDKVRPTVVLKAGTATGSSGCNTYTATYSLKGDSLTFGPTAVTKLGCGPTETAIEHAYLDRLAQVAAYNLGDPGLLLEDQSGANLLTFSAANTSLDGSWSVTGYLTNDGNGFTGVVDGSEVTAAFAPSGTVTGSTGCNSYNGPYTTGSAGAIALGPLVTTRKACLNTDLDRQETSFVAALEASVHADVTSSDAVLSNAAGQHTVTLSRS